MNHFSPLILGILIVFGGFIVIGCSQNSQTPQDSQVIQEKQGTTPAVQKNLQLSQDQQEALLFLAQEERLARDVYALMHQQRGIKKFDNILSSEENHQQAVENLLLQYGLNNPNHNMKAGEYLDEELMTLYNTLTTQGMVSTSDALQIGIVIETKDIADIEAMMGDFDEYPDIQKVLKNLLEGSQRHLQAFSK